MYERGEGGEEGGAQNVKPTRWKVVFLAESLVGVPRGLGPSDSRRLQPECLCGPGSD